MRSRSNRGTTLLLFAGFSCALALPCCNHDGHGFDVDVGLQAVYTADDPEPAPLTLSMVGGASSGTAFDVELHVTGIDGFFGAAFRVEFDSEALRYEGFGTEGSFIVDPAVPTDFRAQLDPNAPGSLVVNATRQGPVAGVDADGSRLLMTLSFSVAHAVEGSRLDFGADVTRQVTTCPEPPAACAIILDTDLTWSGGTVITN